MEFLLISSFLLLYENISNSIYKINIQKIKIYEDINKIKNTDLFPDNNFSILKVEKKFEMIVNKFVSFQISLNYIL
jgi:hypothetical protein